MLGLCEMASSVKGSVRCFDWDKNYGYITTESGDVFVDSTAIRRQQARELSRSALVDPSLPKVLHIGQKVSMDVTLNKSGRMQASNVEVIFDAPYALVGSMSTPTTSPVSSPSSGSVNSLRWSISAMITRSETPAKSSHHKIIDLWTQLAP